MMSRWQEFFAFSARVSTFLFYYYQFNFTICVVTELEWHTHRKGSTGMTMMKLLHFCRARLFTLQTFLFVLFCCSSACLRHARQSENKWKFFNVKNDTHEKCLNISYGLFSFLPFFLHESRCRSRVTQQSAGLGFLSHFQCISLGKLLIVSRQCQPTDVNLNVFLTFFSCAISSIQFYHLYTAKQREHLYANCTRSPKKHTLQRSSRRCSIVDRLMKTNCCEMQRTDISSFAVAASLCWLGLLLFFCCKIYDILCLHPLPALFLSYRHENRSTTSRRRRASSTEKRSYSTLVAHSTLCRCSYRRATAAPLAYHVCHHRHRSRCVDCYTQLHSQRGVGKTSRGKTFLLMDFPVSDTQKYQLLAAAALVASMVLCYFFRCLFVDNSKRFSSLSLSHAHNGSTLDMNVLSPVSQRVQTSPRRSLDSHQITRVHPWISNFSI